MTTSTDPSAAVGHAPTSSNIGPIHLLLFLVTVAFVLDSAILLAILNSSVKKSKDAVAQANALGELDLYDGLSAELAIVNAELQDMYKLQEKLLMGMPFMHRLRETVCHLARAYLISHNRLMLTTSVSIIKHRALAATLRLEQPVLSTTGAPTVTKLPFPSENSTSVPAPPSAKQAPIPTDAPTSLAIPPVHTGYTVYTGIELPGVATHVPVPATASPVPTYTKAPIPPLIGGGGGRRLNSASSPTR